MQERTNVIHVGCETQLFLDDYAVDDVWNMRTTYIDI